jgi:hypothetical protein
MALTEESCENLRPNLCLENVWRHKFRPDDDGPKNFDGSRNENIFVNILNLGL